MLDSRQGPVSRQGPTSRPAAPTLAADTLVIPYVVCDVFTPRGLAGNQVAVFPDAEQLPDGLRAALTREMSFSESVFVTHPEPGSQCSLAIYTPAGEIPFAGHPVLGAAVVLADAGDCRLVLHTRASPIAVRIRADGRARAEAWMQQPWPEAVQVDAALVRRALRDAEASSAVGYDNGARYALVRLRNTAQVAALDPDLAAIGRLGHGLLCFAGHGSSWKARMFAPALGVSEDPATGSAAGPLAVHLHATGLLDAGDTIEIEQGTEIGRPSLLRARVQVTSEDDRRIEVGGHVVIVAQGAFALAARDVRRAARR
jgi:trans-2,3-dihydro-3-hydroxyanthranilate isomerase